MLVAGDPELKAREERSEAGVPVPDDLLAQIVQPMAEVGRPEDVAETLAWLAGPDNRFVSGQVIYVDGGFEAMTLGDEVARIPA